jgi:hypothetical protein
MTMMESDPKPRGPATFRSLREQKNRSLYLVILSGIILCIGAGYGYARFGSLGAALSAMNGDLLLVDQSFRAADGIRPGSRVALRYALTNLSRKPIKLIGTRSSCTCTLIEDLPVTLAGSETKWITATIKTREDQDILNGSIQLFMDDPNSAEVVLSYSLRFTPLDKGRTQTEKNESSSRHSIEKGDKPCDCFDNSPG